MSRCYSKRCSKKMLLFKLQSHDRFVVLISIPLSYSLVSAVVRAVAYFTNSLLNALVVLFYNVSFYIEAWTSLNRFSSLFCAQHCICIYSGYKKTSFKRNVNGKFPQSKDETRFWNNAKSIFAENKSVKIEETLQKTFNMRILSTK